MRKVILLIIFALLYKAKILGQCSTAGPNSANVVNNLNAGGVSWSGLGNVATSNNVRAIATALLLGDDTDFLVATDFGFSIPSTAAICGIVVQVEKRGVGTVPILGVPTPIHNITDVSARIVKGGMIAGSEHALAGSWPNSDSYYTYGSSTDTWGLTWTPAEINSPDFGFAISADLSLLLGLGILPNAEIDHIRITVYYSNPLPIELLNFSAECSDKKTTIKYAVASQINNDYFEIQRSEDGTQFETIATIDGAGSTSQLMEYTYIDHQPVHGVSYYRLKQTDFDGNYKIYSPVVNVCEPQDLLTIYPNPAQDHFTVEIKQKGAITYTLELQDTQGRIIRTMLVTGNQPIIFDCEELMNGIYFVRLLKDSQHLSTEKIKIN